MEMCEGRSIYLEHTSEISPKACDLDLKKREQAATHQPFPGQAEFLCPQPRRAVRTPYTVDSLEILCCTPRGESPTPKKDPSLDILSLFFSKVISTWGVQNEIDVYPECRVWDAGYVHQVLFEGA
ncbi:uncharacterized protein LOC113273672 isoform X2 [Papaver somniferum]|uniref:uncharacterized protein LOC113273672 isoform X2 n=1 Tax=Papaver somniferum TaxID=3469 RepID=UPI000E6F9479|nr:uncharacterized protein LOC113273672 isoform X2 [Papaver somniferum]